VHDSSASFFDLTPVQATCVHAHTVVPLLATQCVCAVTNPRPRPPCGCVCMCTPSHTTSDDDMHAGWGTHYVCVCHQAHTPHAVSQPWCGSSPRESLGSTTRFQAPSLQPARLKRVPHLPCVDLCYGVCRAPAFVACSAELLQRALLL
jgi:hypothetical protein